MEDICKMNDVVIKIEDLHKQYRLGTIGGGTLQADLQSCWARVRGKEDPNIIIGAKKHIKNETFMALYEINLEVYKGDTLGVIGGNGAGKSTMLKILSRVTAPTKGNVFINGRISSMLEVGTGFNGELTGRENIYLNGAILGMSNAEVDSKIEHIIDFSEIRQFIDTPVKRYSSGMYVKLAFAVAAHLDSEILVMDEVLAVGDMKFQQKCLGKMGDVANKEGRTVLYVSHNMNTIRQLCNRCMVLERGLIIYDGSVEEAIQIYMGNKKNKETSYDYNNYIRTDSVTRKVFIKHIELNTQTNEIAFGEKLSLNISYNVNGSFNNLYFRIVILYLDDTPIGLSLTPNLCEKNISGEIIEKIELNTQILAPGEYLVNLICFEVNNFGAYVIHDIIKPAFYFTVLSNKTVMYNLEWDRRWWGNIKFPDAKVTKY